MAVRTTALTPGLAERERVLRIIRAHAAEIRARGVTRLSLFASLARGEAGRESDVDLLIEVDPDARFTDLGQAWLRLATQRGIEIMSEPSRHLRDDLKKSHQDIPWRSVADLGNVLLQAVLRGHPAKSALPRRCRDEGPPRRVQVSAGVSRR